MQKNIIKILLLGALLIFPIYSYATVEVEGGETRVLCDNNLPPTLTIEDPSCWTSISGGYFETCHWEPTTTECTKDIGISSIDIDDEEGVVGNDYTHFWVAFDYYDLGGIYTMDGSVGVCKPKMVYDYNIATAGTSDEVRDKIEAWQAEMSTYANIDNLDEWKESWNDPCPDGEAGSTCIDTIYANTCGPMTCSNASPFPPVDYQNWVDDGTAVGDCYYTTVSEWGVPDEYGIVYATSVIQHSTQNPDECVSEEPYKLASPIVDIKAKSASGAIYSDGVVNVNKDEGLDIEWLSQYASSCAVPGDSTGVEWVGSKELSGSSFNINVSGAPKPLTSSASPTTMSYKLSCQNVFGIPATDSVDVSVTCTPDLNPAWGECDKSCGPGGQEHRTLTYGNCFTQNESRACDPVPAECPVVSDWREVQP